jgi:hypothetical protein
MTPLAAHRDEATHPRLSFPDQPMLPPLDRPWHWTIHLQRPVRAPMMLILEGTSQDPLEMRLVQGRHVVQAFAAEPADEALGVGVLPRTPRGDHDVLDPHMPHSLPKRGTVDAVPIAQQIPQGLAPRGGIHDLAGGPVFPENSNLL